MTRFRTLLRLGAAAAFLPLVACKGLLDVDSPGRIPDEDLNDPDALSALVVGMSYDLAEASDNISDFESLASGELWHGGSYDWGDVPRGIILPEDVNDAWEEPMQANFVAEDGIRRMKEEIFKDNEAAFNENALVAQAYMYGGFADRLAGENVCQTVVEEMPQPNTVEFDQGIEKFTLAITIGEAAGADEVVTAAHAGRASLRAWKGDWVGAVDDATQVPIDFQLDAVLNTESNSNTIAYETHDRFEYTVFNTAFANYPDDPRAPWQIVYDADGSVAVGANGATPMYQQEKYEDIGADIPLTKGTEMLVLRAEAALRNGDIPGAFALLNEARAFYEMEPLAVPATLEEAWPILQHERGATVWLENRRLWDLRRWFEETGPAHNDFLNGRDKCMPFSKEEVDANPNIP